MFINDLPEEILIEILSYLTHLELFLVARKVCLLWKDISLSSVLWKAVDVDKELKNIYRNTLHFSIYGKYSKDILTKILHEIKENIRDFRFNTSLVPLAPTSEGDPSLGSLGCIACKILFKTSDTNNKSQLAIRDSEDITHGKGENEQLCHNKESKHFLSKNIEKATEKEAMYVNLLQIKKAFSKREFDFIEIRETTSTLSFVQIDNFLSSVGKVKVLGIYTTQVLADVTKESLGNLRQLEGVHFHAKFNIMKDLYNPYYLLKLGENYERDVEIISCFQFLFKNLQNVTKLITDVLDNDALLVLLQNNRKLRHLSLRQCDYVTKAAFVNMPDLDYLVHFEITGCSDITDFEVEMFANCCKNLRHININRCVKVTYNGIGLLIKKCKWLTELECDANTFKNLMINFDMYETNSTQKHIHLRKLSLVFCFDDGKITDNFVQNIADFCPDIRELNLRGRYLLIDIGIEDVIQTCQDLKIVNIWKGPNDYDLTYKTVKL